MRVLRNIVPTDEQMVIINRIDPGHLIVRGAAGSGKTSSALLRLRIMTRWFVERRERLRLPGPTRVLVLTFNRTLRGYVTELARNEAEVYPEVDVDISTFASWAQSITGLTPATRVSNDGRAEKVTELGRWMGLDSEFLVDEVEYALGRFLPESIDQYLTATRVGRGRSPQFDRNLLMTHVLQPYELWKRENGLHDWNDLAVATMRANSAKYDVIVADEVQDLNANDIRAINSKMNDNSSVTFVLDQAQQIYARGFTWREVGMNITGANSRRLAINHRNKRQTAAFAAPIVRGLDISEDGTIPDLDHCVEGDYMPIVLRGRYHKQIARAMELLDERLRGGQTAAFMHPKGWFNEIEAELIRLKKPFVSLTRQKDWPEGDEQIALLTLHSSKGLEFDHVFLLGLNDKFTRHGDEDDDAMLDKIRRLFAMAVTRARESVVVGYLPSEKSVLVDYFEDGTYILEDV